MPYMQMAKIDGKYHLLDASVVTPIIETAVQEPSPEDADSDKMVAVYNAIKKCWEPRFWFDFPSHPSWTPEQREAILKMFPRWRKIYVIKTICGQPAVDIVRVGGDGGVNVRRYQVCNICHASLAH